MPVVADDLLSSVMRSALSGGDIHAQAPIVGSSQSVHCGLWFSGHLQALSGHTPSGAALGVAVSFDPFIHWPTPQCCNLLGLLYRLWQFSSMTQFTFGLPDLFYLFVCIILCQVSMLIILAFKKLSLVGLDTLYSIPSEYISCLFLQGNCRILS